MKASDRDLKGKAPRGTLGRRYPNPRLVRINFCYKVGEAANLLGKHKRTILEWTKQGLPLCVSKRPFLIHGTDLRAFLEAKRAEGKRRCKPGEMYCFRCRAPKAPARGMVEYHPQTDTIGNLKAHCELCNTPMNQRTSRTKMERVQGIWDVTFTVA